MKLLRWRKRKDDVAIEVHCECFGKEGSGPSHLLSSFSSLLFQNEDTNTYCLEMSRN